MPGALSKTDLFARLAEGHAAGITVLTPNRRLAKSLVLEFDDYQAGRNLKSWEDADIQYVDDFVRRLYEEALYSEIATELPLLLTPLQEQHLWEGILEGSGLLAVAGAAAECRAAWKLKHAWRIGDAGGNEDVAAFSRWSASYRKKTAGDIDEARLPDLIARHLESLRTPKLVVAYGFDAIEPQVKELLGRFALAECQPEPAASAVRKLSFASAREELEHAACWARARLEAGGKRVGVIVPDLEERRREIERVFTRVMGRREAFNISASPRLGDYALIDGALALIELSMREISFARASRLLRSPFLGGAESEMELRALLDARLRRDLGAMVSLPLLVAEAKDVPVLREQLEALFERSKDRPESPSAWARHFSAVLKAAGFPGERAPDASESQALAAWHEALGELARLDHVYKKISPVATLAAIRRICADTPFQPKSGDAPVQVLGALESKGLRFDCLRVCGLTDEHWPLGARPNPFLPISAQKAAGIAEASAEGSLEHCRRITAGWRTAAPEVTFSWPRRDADRDLQPSPLIGDVVEGEAEEFAYPRHRDLIFAARRLEAIPDGQAPALATNRPKGGTGILADHAACPFRAFARWRLGARELEEPAEGLDARARGSLLHALMKHLWGELKDSKALQKDNSAAIERAAAAAVNELELEGRFAELEKARLAKLAREWLEVEKERPAFQILHLEKKIPLKAANLEISGRIDRMDALESGGHAVIDYKTGNPTPNDWKGPRPEEPQLPLYALSAKEEVTAVAFAKLKTGDMKYMGFSRDKGAIPGVKVSEDWDTHRAAWRKDVDALGAGFAAGDARVEPKDGLNTCKFCDLQTVCRVYEKVNSLQEEEGGE